MASAAEQQTAARQQQSIRRVFTAVLLMRKMKIALRCPANSAVAHHIPPKGNPQAFGELPVGGFHFPITVSVLISAVRLCEQGYRESPGGLPAAAIAKRFVKTRAQSHLCRLTLWFRLTNRLQTAYTMPHRTPSRVRAFAGIRPTTSSQCLSLCRSWGSLGFPGGL